MWRGTLMGRIDDGGGGGLGYCCPAFSSAICGSRPPSTILSTRIGIDDANHAGPCAAVSRRLLAPHLPRTFV